jgi:hypothetical protein
MRYQCVQGMVDLLKGWLSSKVSKTLVKRVRQKYVIFLIFPLVWKLINKFLAFSVKISKFAITPFLLLDNRLLGASQRDFERVHSQLWAVLKSVRSVSAPATFESQLVPILMVQ